MAGKAVAVLAILLGILLAVAAARGGPLVDDTNPWNVLDTADDALLATTLKATVSVQLLQSNGKDPAHIYGDISARVSSSPRENVLFKKSFTESVPVSHGDLIPLSTTVMRGLPINSNIRFRANLMDYLSSNQRYEVALGYATLHAQTSGTNSQIISGKDGNVLVKANWSVE